MSMEESGGEPSFFLSYWFHQFDAVAKRIIDVGAAESIERFIPNDRSASLFATADEFIQSLDE